MSKHAKKNAEVEDDNVPPVDPATTFDVGDTVKIGETFAAYRGELGRVTGVRFDPAGGNFPVADVELKSVKQPGGEAVWFNNVPFSQLEKVTE